MVLAEICNYNGFRNQWHGVGRLERCILSLPKSLIAHPRIRWRVVDSGSTDGSHKLLEQIPYYERLYLRRMEGTNPWYATTRTNAHNLWLTLKEASEPYLWRIENDSVFLDNSFIQTGKFLWTAVKLLEKYPFITVVHFRRWTPVDRADLPGAAANSDRVERILNINRDYAYLIQQVPQKLLRIDITDDLPDNFIPDKSQGYGFCTLWDQGEPKRGAVYKNGTRWYRFIEEKLATYTNHGWIARTEVLRNIFIKERPETEEEISSVVRKYGRAARLKRDAFIAAGWRTRLRWSGELLNEALIWAEKNPEGTVIDNGGQQSIWDSEVIKRHYLKTI